MLGGLVREDIGGCYLEGHGDLLNNPYKPHNTPSHHGSQPTYEVPMTLQVMFWRRGSWSRTEEPSLGILGLESSDNPGV